MSQEYSTRITESLSNQVNQVVERAAGKRTFSNWWGLRHNSTELFRWLPITDQPDGPIFRHLAGHSVPKMGKLDCENLVLMVMADYVDIEKPKLNDPVDIGGRYLRRITEWNSDEFGILFRRTDFALDTFVRASAAGIDTSIVVNIGNPKALSRKSNTNLVELAS